jgi:hypothetical protein
VRAAVEATPEALPTSTDQAQPRLGVSRRRDKPAIDWYARYQYLPPQQCAGSILRFARSLKHLKYEQVAALTAIPKAHLVEMERGSRAIANDEAHTLAALLGIDAWALQADTAVA